VAFIEDMTQFFRLEDFAVEATFAGGVKKFVMFDREYFQAEVGTVGQEASQPQMMLATEDLPVAFAEGSAVTIGGVAYIARNIRHDGTGASVVDLSL
jgi:hypothetical protein